MKVIKGSCTRCGLCGCWDRPEANGKEWCEGLPEHAFEWYKQHPSQEEFIFKLLRASIENRQVTAAIPSIGVFSFVYRRGIGLCTSDTDKSCPFLDQSDLSCRLWGTVYLPTVCSITPQNLVNEDQIAQWAKDHPQCGFYWVDE